MVTLDDVARQVGVSAKTVSRVVNNQGEISPTTRQRVLDAIKQLGYYPNLPARNLATRRTNTIAVVTARLDSHGPPRIVTGIERQAEELGYSLLLDLLHRPDETQIEQTIEATLAQRADGIIWAAWEIDNNLTWFTPDLIQRLPPILFVSVPHPGLATISIGNHSGAVLAMQHLLQTGRRKIGVITGNLRFVAAQSRFAAWRESLAEAGLQPDPGLIFEGDWTPASGAMGMQVLLDRVHDLDAVFVANDVMAVAAMGVLHQRSRRIPEDIAVVGFDNSPESQYFYPSLTTVSQHLVETGKLCVQVLHELIQAKRNNNDTLPAIAKTIPPELIVRSSSARS